MVLGILEGVPYPIPGRAVPPRGQGVGTVWAGKESIVGHVALAGGRVHRPGAVVLVGVLVSAGFRPGRRPGTGRSLVDTSQR